jgi:hypothetical protein
LEVNSDDSIAQTQYAKMEEILRELDPVSVASTFLSFISKEYLIENQAKEFQWNEEYCIDFFSTICSANNLKFKKVSIVKDFICPFVDHVNVFKCSSIPKLAVLKEHVATANGMLVQGSSKLKRLLEQIGKRMD